MSQVLKDKVAIVTGGGRGLGRAFALKFADEGAKLLIPDISLERAEATAKEIRDSGGEAVALEADISDENDTGRMAEKVMEVYGQADILLNNAAIFYGLMPQPWDSLTVDEWDRVFAVNVKGTWLCCKAIAPIMRKQGEGKIINISSASINMPFGYDKLHYVSSKAAVITITQQLARALGPHGININAIAPGYTRTEATLQRDYENFAEKVVEEQCIKRREEPEDLVAIAVFLASKESDFITGQLLVADGGIWLR